MVSSTLGSPTNTCWNRRSSAGVLLDALAVLVERRRADHAQLAAGEHRLEHVAGVHGALAARAGADDGVQLVDERDDLAVGVLDLARGRPSAAPRTRRGTSRRPPCAPRSSETSRLPRSDSGTSPATMRWARPSTTAVLPTPGSPMRTGLFLVRRRQHLHDAADLGVAADDRVELALAGPRGEVDAVLLQRLVGALGVRAGDPRAAADLGERRAQRVGGGADGASAARATGDSTVASADQQVLGGHVLVAELPGDLSGVGQDGVGLPGQTRR